MTAIWPQEPGVGVALLGLRCGVCRPAIDFHAHLLPLKELSRSRSLSTPSRGGGCGLSTNRPVPKPLGGWDCRLGVSRAGRAAAGPGSRGSREPTHTMGLSALEWVEPAPSDTVFTRTQLVIGPVSQWPLLTRSACIPVGCPPQACLPVPRCLDWLSCSGKETPHL